MTMTLKEAEEEYGDIEGYIDRLRELKDLGDLKHLDIKSTLRDINFIREEAGKNRMHEAELIERLVS